VARGLSIALVLLGTVVLLDWAVQLPHLERVRAWIAIVKPNTAIGFALVGCALWLRQRPGAPARLSLILSTAAGLLGALTLVEYLCGWNVGIDEILFKEFQFPALPPGRMSPATAVLFVVLAIALALWRVRFRASGAYPTQLLAIAVALVSFVFLLGYAYDAPALYRIGRFIPIALPTAAGFFLSALTVLFARPDVGLMRLVVSDSAAGTMTRRLLPAALVIPSALGWIRLRGQQVGLYNLEVGLALYASANVILFTALIWWTGMTLLRTEHERSSAEASVREAEEAIARALGRSEFRFRVLAAASHSFAQGNLELPTLYEAIARHATQAVGDLCVIRLLSEDGQTFSLAALDHSDPAALQLLSEAFRDVGEESLAQVPSSRVVRTGKPLVLDEDALHSLRSAIPPRFYPYLDRFGIRGVLAVPLWNRSTIIGTIAVARTGAGPPYTPSDAALLAELSDRAGEAVHNAHLHRDLRAALDARDDFVAMAGHELRTPLAAHLLQMEGALRSLERDPRAPVLERLRRMERSGRRLERLVSQLLDVSRIAAGRLVIEPGDVDLAELTSEVVARFSDTAAQARSGIVLRSAHRVWGSWDRSRIDQVLTNLLTNALKYGAGRPVEIDLLAEESEAVVRVTDHGIGMEREHQARIFERYERAAPAREFGGLGLGLWITRRITEASGGSIDVESSPGMGATFTVRLPRRLGPTSATR
jgi:signal transduction histidine kinase